MGWEALETLLDNRRDLLRADPQAAEDALRRDLLSNSAPPAQIRLRGLLTSSLRLQSRWPQARHELEKAQRIATRSPLALTELQIHAATLTLNLAMLHLESWDQADSSTRLAFLTAHTLPLDTTPTSEWGRRRRRIRQRAYVGAIVLRGQYHLELGNSTKSLEAAYTALQYLPTPSASGPTPSIVYDTALGPFSLLAVTLTKTASTPNQLLPAAATLQHLLETLPSTDILLTNNFRLAEATILSRLGYAPEAHTLFLSTLAALYSAGATTAYNYGLDLFESHARRHYPAKLAQLLQELKPPTPK